MFLTIPVTTLDADNTTTTQKKQPLGRSMAKSNMKELVNAGEVSVFLCVLFCILECLCVCVCSCGLEKRKGVWTSREPWALPRSICHKGPLSHYACWRYLWEIRSDPTNETHAKGLHGNISSQLLIFILKRFIPSLILLHYRPPSPVFAFIWTGSLAQFHHIRSLTCNRNLQDLLKWKLKRSKDLEKWYSFN